MFGSGGRPRLEREHMGAIVLKCWNGKYASAEDVRGAVEACLDGEGWGIEGYDDMKGFSAGGLYAWDGQEAYDSYMAYWRG
ncbi:hypothetical protein PSPO01_14440 [Paraphaeosphaeria sporulosa]